MTALLKPTAAPATLTFDAATHTYRHRGQIVPGTTKVLQALHSMAGIPAAVLQAAAERGTATHAACEYWDEGDLDESALSDAIKPRLDAWKRFCSDKQPTWVGIEVKLFDPVHLYAGTADRFGYIDGEPWTIDIKTAALTHPVWGLQSAAYSAAAKFPGRRGTVRLLADGTYRLDEWSDPLDIHAFRAALVLTRWKAHKQI